MFGSLHSWFLGAPAVDPMDGICGQMKFLRRAPVFTRRGAPVAAFVCSPPLGPGPVVGFTKTHVLEGDGWFTRKCWGCFPVCRERGGSVTAFDLNWFNMFFTSRNPRRRLEFRGYDDRTYRLNLAAKAGLPSGQRPLGARTPEFTACAEVRDNFHPEVKSQFVYEPIIRHAATSAFLL